MDIIATILKAQVREPIPQTPQESQFLRAPSINTRSRSYLLIRKSTVSKVPRIRLYQRIIKTLKAAKEVKTAFRIIKERRTQILWLTHNTI